VMFGKLENPLNKALPDLNMRELVTLAPLVILAFWIGIYPTYFTKYLDEPVNAIVERVRPDYFNTGASGNSKVPASQKAGARIQNSEFRIVR